MAALDAKKIIESLANGIDPETGEVFPNQSPFNNPEVIRALFVASQALDQASKREQRARNLPCNTGKAWAGTEDEALLTAFDGGLSIKDLATKHDRTSGAITSRLIRLGRITDRIDADVRA